MTHLLQLASPVPGPGGDLHLRGPGPVGGRRPHDPVAALGMQKVKTERGNVAEAYAPFKAIPNRSDDGRSTCQTAVKAAWRLAGDHTHQAHDGVTLAAHVLQHVEGEAVLLGRHPGALLAGRGCTL